MQVQPIPVIVRAVHAITPLIREFVLAPADGGLFPAFSGGSHVVVEMPAKGRTLRNPYSLLGSPDDRSEYRIAVRRLEVSRGGSQFMHDRVNVGSRLAVMPPVNLFPIDRTGRHHVLVAGGVGITPILGQMHELARAKLPFELHYAVRGPDHAGFCQRIESRWPGCLVTYVESAGQQIDSAALLAARPLGTHVYVCGPAGMIDAVIAAADALGWPRSHVHFERFSAPPPGQPFDVFLQRAGLRVHVSAEQTLLEAIEAAGVNAPYLCRGGACGQCETEVLELDGELVHHDVFLSDADRAGRRKIMPCVSRAVCRTLVLDR